VPKKSTHCLNFYGKDERQAFSFIIPNDFAKELMEAIPIDEDDPDGLLCYELEYTVMLETVAPDV
jgi:hypothetical protein